MKEVKYLLWCRECEAFFETECTEKHALESVGWFETSEEND